MFAEGNAGATAVQLTVSLNTAAHGGVSVTLGTGGTATTGGACAPTVDATVGGGASQVLQWAAGDGAPKQVTVNICGDTRDDEDVDQLDVALSAPSSGIVAPTASVVHVSITDDDALPGVTVADVTGLEPSTAFATSTVTVPLTLSAMSNRDVDVTIGTFPPASRTGAASATAGSSCSRGVDYLTTSHSVHFPAGSTLPTKQPAVTLCFDGVREGTSGPLAGMEALEVRASSAVNSVLTKPAGIVFIKDQ